MAEEINFYERPVEYDPVNNNVHDPWNEDWFPINKPWEDIVDEPASDRFLAVVAIATVVGTYVICSIFCLLVVALVGSQWWEALLWAVPVTLVVLLLAGISNVQSQHFRLFERLGKFAYIQHAGLKFMFLIGVIDKIPLSGDHHIQFQPISIYTDEDDGIKPAIDFKDVSAPIKATANVSVGVFAGGSEAFLKHIEDTNLRKRIKKSLLNRHILRYVYVQDHPTLRAKEVLDRFIRAFLENGTHDSYQERREDIIHRILESQTVTGALAQMGLFLNQDKPVLLGDIKLPEEVQTTRRRRLEGVTRREYTAEVGLGINLAVANLLGMTIEYDDKGRPKPLTLNLNNESHRLALETVMQREGIDNLQHVDSLNVIGGSVTDVLRLFNLGQQKKS